MGIKAYQRNKNSSAYHPLLERKTKRLMRKLPHSQPGPLLRLQPLEGKRHPRLCLSVPRLPESLHHSCFLLDLNFR